MSGFSPRYVICPYFNFVEDYVYIYIYIYIIRLWVIFNDIGHFNIMVISLTNERGKLGRQKTWPWMWNSRYACTTFCLFISSILCYHHTPTDHAHDENENITFSTAAASLHELLLLLMKLLLLLLLLLLSSLLVPSVVVHVFRLPHPFPLASYMVKNSACPM